MGHALVVGGIRLLEILFAGGLIGSALVVVLTSIEDLREVFQRDTSEEEASQVAGDSLTGVARSAPPLAGAHPRAW